MTKFKDDEKVFVRSLEVLAISIEVWKKSSSFLLFSKWQSAKKVKIA